MKFGLYNKTNLRLKPLKSEIGKIENGKMDFQPNGMLIETFGASNNKMAFATPIFEDAKFIVFDKDVSLKNKILVK